MAGEATSGLCAVWSSRSLCIRRAGVKREQTTVEDGGKAGIFGTFGNMSMEPCLV